MSIEENDKKIKSDEFSEEFEEFDLNLLQNGESGMGKGIGNIGPLYWIKTHEKAILLSLIFLFGLSGAFALGMLSQKHKAKPPIKILGRELGAPSTPLLSPIPEKIETVKSQPGAAIKSIPKTGIVVASKSGSKYHFPTCPGAKNISEGNKIWFESIEAARAAGYTPAANCKGLK